MAKCECLPGCPFFNDRMPDNSGLGMIYKEKYCLGDNTACARYMVFRKLGKGAVPINLYPNMTARGLEIIHSHDARVPVS